MAGRPINLVIRNATNFTMRGMRFVQSQFWTLAVHTAQNVLLEDITIRSVSNSSVRPSFLRLSSAGVSAALASRTDAEPWLQAPTQNTDGIDTFYTDSITLRRWDVTGGDEAVAPKANTSNLLVQDAVFRGGDCVAIGSIGQYPGVYEFIENVTAERVRAERCQYAAYVKTWTGVEQGVPPNGGGGGTGHARNIGACEAASAEAMQADGSVW